MTDYMNKTGERPMPLEGVCVLEYGVFHAGPGASAILGDLGADVIKIENGVGDPERYWKEVGGMNLSMPDGESAMFQISNRNKKRRFGSILRKRKDGKSSFGLSRRQTFFSQICARAPRSSWASTTQAWQKSIQRSSMQTYPGMAPKAL